MRTVAGSESEADEEREAVGARWDAMREKIYAYILCVSTKESMKVQVQSEEG